MVCRAIPAEKRAYFADCFSATPPVLTDSAAPASASLQFASIASGSNGNCYYVGNAAEAVLIDAGISLRETVRRATRAGIDLERVRAVFISHEHADHIRGIEALARKWNLPVYATPGCLARCRMERSAHLGIPMHNAEAVRIGGLTITAFAKAHDACDPVSFVVEGAGGLRVGVFTDLGHPCSALRGHFARCHAAFLESNYDADMLRYGRYPAHLKARISGGRGHLSNDEALDVFLQHRSPQLSHLILAHLSANNNDPRIVEHLFRPHAGGVEVVVASRYAESALYEIQPGAAPAVRAEKIATLFERGRLAASKEEQLKLF